MTVSQLLIRFWEYYSFSQPSVNWCQKWKFMSNQIIVDQYGPFSSSYVVTVSQLHIQILRIFFVRRMSKNVICKIQWNHICLEPHFGLTLYIEDGIWFHILTEFGWNKTIRKVRKWSHKWYYHLKTISIVIPLKVNRPNI